MRTTLSAVDLLPELLVIVAGNLCSLIVESKISSNIGDDKIDKKRWTYKPRNADSSCSN